MTSKSAARECNQPELHAHRFLRFATDDPIVLCEGPVKVQAGTRTVSGQGSVALDFYPEPRIVLECETALDGGDPSGRDLMDVQRWQVEAPETSVETQFLPAQVATSLRVGSDPASTCRMKGVLPRAQVVCEGDPVSSVAAAVVNFAPVYGDPLVLDDGTHSDTWTGRISIELEDWNILLEAPQDSHDRHNRLREQGGFGVTHVCRIRPNRADASPGKEMATVLCGLNHWLSFCAGRWCGAVCPEGFDAAGQRAWWQWGVPQISAYRQTHNWFDDLRGREQLQAFQPFWGLWNDPDWKEELALGIHWYVEANSKGGPVESRLVMAAVALEMLSGIVLAEKSGVLSGGGFENLPAWDKYRVLLDHCSIDPSIPGRFSALSNAAASQREWYDGPGAIAGIRNAIIHQRPAKRKLLKSISGLARHQALETALVYLELVILHILGYCGVYFDRTKAEKAYEVVPVPWTTACDSQGPSVG